MTARNERKDLGFLGEDFQYKLVREFTDDKELFKDLSSVIDQNMFTDPNLKTYVGVMKEYYEKYDSVPSYDIIQVKLFEKSHSDTEREFYAAIVDKIKHTPTDGSEFIRDTATKFFKQQNIIKTANEILKIAGNGDVSNYDKCVELLNGALNAGTHNDLGSGVFDNEEETLSDDYRIPIPTGIEGIDETLEGGIGKGELGVIVGPSSFGKSQPLDARILTPNGYKLMGEMSVGDYVIGSDGKPHVVSGIYPQGKRPIYKVSFSNGTSCECDIEHLWNVNSLYQRCGKKYIAGVSKNRDDKIYAPDHSFKTLSLREILEKGLIKNGTSKYNFKVPVVKPIEFAEQETKFDPYLVGYYIGDGSFKRVEITVGKNDEECVESILKPILNEDLHIFYREKRNIYQFDIIGQTRKNLKECFSTECKSDSKFIPKEYLFNSIEKRIAVLQGIMDSDGHANKNGSCEFCSKSKQLALDVQFLVRSLGGFASLRESSSSYFSKKYNKRIDCGKRYRVTISMCDNSIPLFRMERKQTRVKYRTRGADALFMTNAEYVGEKEAQCIMVDSDEHLYVTEDFIVTHNTSLTTAIAGFASTYPCEQNNYEGFKVLQIVFEDRVKQIQRKHFGRITGIESKDLGKPEYINTVRDQLDHYEGKEMMEKNLRILRLPSGEKTAWDIERIIKRFINNGFRPDLVIVDYFECLAHRNEGTLSEWEQEGKTMRKFEAMAGTLNMAFWIPLQGTKESVNMELVTMDKAGGSFKKIQIAHIVMSIARSNEDIAENKATIAILKNRAGKAGKVFNNVEFNNGTCRISTANCDDGLDSMFAFDKKQQKDRDNLASEIFKKYKAEHGAK